jgi:uncharacterized protein (DUF488 family)
MKGMIRISEDGSEPGKTIYTVGHSNRTLEEFISILEKYEIKVVIDVRRFPTSRKYPWFSKENLKKRFSEIGLEYIWLGDLLGGYRKGGYVNYMKTGDYIRGISTLKNIINREENVVIMCSEKLWFRCHRRFISDTLSLEGYEVIHIIDHDKTYIHKKATP